MAETTVRGRLGNPRIPDRAVREVLSFLSEKGYDQVTASADDSQPYISFVRHAKIESVVNELVPKIEQLGYDTWHDLELTGYRGDVPVSSYKEGRIKRKY